MGNIVNNTSHSSNSKIGFTDLLAVLFIGLKLTHHIDWSWWWVLSPLWISFGFGFVIQVIEGIIIEVRNRNK